MASDESTTNRALMREVAGPHLAPGDAGGARTGAYLKSDNSDPTATALPELAETTSSTASTAGSVSVATDEFEGLTGSRTTHPRASFPVETLHGFGEEGTIGQAGLVSAARIEDIQHSVEESRDRRMRRMSEEKGKGGKSHTAASAGPGTQAQAQTPAATSADVQVQTTSTSSAVQQAEDAMRRLLKRDL
ncbi:hypothetical protein HK102_011203, partial [Quaeritorhiza haematococci]